MPQVAIGIVGAAIAAGAEEAGLLGSISLLSAASAGFSIGAVVGGILFAPSAPTTQQTGSRLGDLSVTSSTYGSPIPIGFGTIRLAGNIIWATPISEVKHVASLGGGGGGKGGLSKGGGGGSTQTTFEYFGNFALALARGPADRVMKIWMDSNLVYDITAGIGLAPVTAPDPLVGDPGTDGFGPFSASVATQQTGLNFRFYPGDEAQLPDSLIEADKGVGNVPPFRGTCYLVFEDLPLAAYGNRIPNVSVELAFSSTPYQVVTALYGPAAPDTLGTLTPFGITINPLTLRGYLVSAPPAGILEFDLLTMKVISSHTLGDIIGNPIFTDSIGFQFGDSFLVMGFDQKLYAGGGTGLFTIDTNTWTGTVETVASNGIACPIGMIGPNGVENYIVMGGGTAPDIEVHGIAHVDPSGTVVHAMTPGDIAAGSGHAYVLEAIGDGTGATVIIDQITISVHASGGLIPDIVRDASIRPVIVISGTEVDVLADGFSASPDITQPHDPSGIVFDPTDNGVVFQVSPTYSGVADKPFLVKVDIASGTILWATKIVNGSVGLAGAGAAYSNIGNGRYAKLYGTHVVVLDSTTGAIISDIDWATPLAPFGIEAGQQVYDDISNRIIAYVGSQWVNIPVDRATPGTATLDEIFTAVCEEAGMDVADFDVTDLATVPVPGYTISQRAAAADIEKPLAQLFQIDAIETDWILKFQQRGGAVVVDIPEDMLIRPSDTSQSNGQPFTETRIQEVDLPARQTLTYSDPAANFQTNTQMAKRVRAPIATVFSDQQADLQVGIVISADTAIQYAERLLYQAWNQRTTVSAMLPRDFMWLDASDPVTLTLDGGPVVRGRLGPVDYGVDYSMTTTVVGESEGQYTSNAVGQIPLGPGSPPITVPLPSQLFVVDIPLLRDTDDALGVGIRTYIAASAFNDLPWPGALIQGSPDSTSWSNIGTATDAATWGHIENALPDAVSSFRTHFDQSLTVSITHGGATLQSVTMAQLNNGFNAAAVFKSNGDVEVIQFRDVVSLGSDRYTLSVLRRGRRGTDTMAEGHAQGETILMLHTSSVQPIVLDNAARGKTGFYRAITAGTSSSSALLDAQILHARDQMPWAPVHVQAATASSDIDLIWTRRTRVGGQPVNAPGPQPLGEASERYEVDIYNAPGTAVLRTLTGLTTPAATYDSADIITDFGTPPATLNVAVYQISETVGRGFGRIDALEVA